MPRWLNFRGQAAPWCRFGHWISQRIKPPTSEYQCPSLQWPQIEIRDKTACLMIIPVINRLLTWPGNNLQKLGSNKLTLPIRMQRRGHRTISCIFIEKKFRERHWWQTNYYILIVTNEFSDVRDTVAYKFKYGIAFRIPIWSAFP